MKKTHFTFVAIITIFSFLLIACSDDNDDDDNQNKHQITDILEFDIDINSENKSVIVETISKYLIRDFGNGVIDTLFPGEGYTHILSARAYTYPSNSMDRTFTIKLRLEEPLYVEIRGKECSNLVLDASETIQYLQLEGFNNIARFNFSNFPNLYTLIVRNWSEMQNIDVRSCVKLEKFVVSQTNISELDLSNNTDITFLDCAQNQLQSLNLSSTIDLEELWAFDNNLTHLDLSANRKLRNLSCAKNALTSLNLSGLKYLNVMRLSNNLIEKIIMDEQPDLREMSVINNLLDKAEIENLFNALPRTSDKYQTVHIFNNPGTELSDKSIAKNKGWVVDTISDRWVD